MLPQESMCELLAAELEKRGFTRDGDIAKRVDKDGVEITVNLKDVTLLGQVFVKAEDSKQTIEQLLKARSASIAAFALFIVGEGIEKVVNDFAAEVAAQAAAAKK